MAHAHTACPKNTLRKTTSKEAAVTRRDWELSRNIDTKQRQNYWKGSDGFGLPGRIEQLHFREDRQLLATNEAIKGFGKV